MSEWTPEDRSNHRCARCSGSLQRFWYFCPDCGASQIWGDEAGVSGAHCLHCDWVISDSFAFCPWCGCIIDDAGDRAEPQKQPVGFEYDADCDYGCGGGVQYPMEFCPWCGEPQGWPYDDDFEGVCAHCRRGVDDEMDFCIWCGEDATGQDLIRPAILRIEQLLRKVGVLDWGYRILVRPGISGVDPQYPNIVEIERRLVTRRGFAASPALVGLIAHELGHSFLFHHQRFACSTRFRQAFGDVDRPYLGIDVSSVSFGSERFSELPVDHVTAYASMHPLEDFSEVFRLYLVRGGRLADLLAEIGRTGKSIKVYEKFLTLHTYLQEIRPQIQEPSEQFTFEWKDD